MRPVPSFMSSCPEGFLECQPFAAPVAYLPAIDEPQPPEHTQHVTVVEIGVDAHTARAAPARHRFDAPHKLRRHPAAFLTVGHRHAVQYDILSVGEPCPFDGVVSGFPVENHGTVGDDVALCRGRFCRLCFSSSSRFSRFSASSASSAAAAVSSAPDTPVLPAASVPVVFPAAAVTARNPAAPVPSVPRASVLFSASGFSKTHP